MKYFGKGKVLLFSTLLGLMGTQIYTYMRYGLFPTNPISVITSSPSFSLKEVLKHSDSVYSVAFSPDGKILASGSKDHTIQLWDVARGLSIATLKGGEGSDWSSVSSVAFSPDGRTLASSGSSDNTIKLWQRH